MQIMDVLASAQGGRLYDNIAEVYGLEPAEVEAVSANVVPFFAQAIERNTLSRGGLADIVGALGDGHHRLYLEDPRFIGSEVMVRDGNAILGHMLGSVDRSRAVADRVSAVSGVGADWVRKLLPILAALLMGALSKQSSGGLGDILRRLPGGDAGGGGGFPQGGDLGDILRRLPGFPGSGGGGGGYGRGDDSDGGQGGGGGGGGGGQGGGMGDIFRRIPGLPGSRDGGGSEVPGLPGSGGSIPGIPDAPRREATQPRVPSGGGAGGSWGGGTQGGGNQGGGADNPFNLPGGLGDILNKIPGMGQNGGQGGGRSGGQGDREQSAGRGNPMPSDRSPRAPQPFPDQGGGLGGSPLPIPGERIPNMNGPRDNPYGDLSDIIRKGQLPDGANIPGGSLGSVVRDILGGMLGFKGRGLFGWILQLLIYRWGWGLLKRILGRMLLGR